MLDLKWTSLKLAHRKSQRFLLVYCFPCISIFLQRWVWKVRQFVVFLPQFDELLLLLLLSDEWDNIKKSRHLHYPHTFELSIAQSVSLLLLLLLLLLFARIHWYPLFWHTLAHDINLVELFYEWFSPRSWQIVITHYKLLIQKYATVIESTWREKKTSNWKTTLLFEWLIVHKHIHAQLTTALTLEMSIFLSAKQNKVIESKRIIHVCVAARTIWHILTFRQLQRTTSVFHLFEYIGHHKSVFSFHNLEWLIFGLWGLE